MTTSLKTILKKLDRLPTSEQNTIAALLKEELKWEGAYAKSQKQLGVLAEEALKEFRAGKTEPMKLK